MGHACESASEQVALYLQSLGIRPSTKAYQYLLFALTQLQQGTPFQNTIWDLTSIHFSQKRKNVLSCVRRELSRAYKQEPKRFFYEGDFIYPAKTDEFLRLGMVAMNKNF